MSKEVSKTEAPAKHELLERIKAVLLEEGFVWATPRGLASDRAQVSDARVTRRIGIIWPGRVRAEGQRWWNRFLRWLSLGFELRYHLPHRVFLGRLDFGGKDDWYVECDDTRHFLDREKVTKLVAVLAQTFGVTVKKHQTDGFRWPLWEK